MSEKNRNKIIRVALLVMLALVICLVSGCSQKNETAAPAAVTPEQAAVPEATEAPAAEAGNEEVTEEMIAEAALAEEAADETAETVEAVEAEQVSILPETPVLLATVNGREIRSDDDYLSAVIAVNEEELENSGYDLTSPELIEALRQFGLDVTIQSVLLHQKAAEFGLDQFTAEETTSLENEAKEQWAALIDNYAGQAGLMTDTSTDEEKVAARAQAEAFFQTMGYDEARFVRETVEGEQESAMADRLMDKLTEGKTVSDEDILNHFNDLVDEDREQYEGNIPMYEFYTQYYGQNSYYVPEGYRGITHILLKVDDELLNTWKDLSARLEEQQSASEAEAAATPTDLGSAEATPEPTPEPVTQEMVDAAEKAILDSIQPTVDEINAKLAAGTSFDDLIKEYGTDPGMQNDATRADGYHVHAESIVWDPAFTAAAAALEKIGDVSKPVVGQNGVHILHYLRDIPGGATELTEDMKAEFAETLLSEMRNAALSDAIEQWKDEATIVYSEEGEKWKYTEEELVGELPEDEPAEEAAEAPAAEEVTVEVAVTEAPAAEETANP